MLFLPLKHFPSRQRFDHEGRSPIAYSHVIFKRSRAADQSRCAWYWLVAASMIRSNTHGTMPNAVTSSGRRQATGPRRSPVPTLN
jgi:hypothetical protein